MEAVMRRPTLLALCLIAASLPAAALAYVRTTTTAQGCTGAEKPIAWKTAVVPYVIDALGAPGVDPPAVYEAVRASMRTWTALPCAGVGFRDDGVVQNAPLGYVQGGSNVNAVKWVTSGWAHSASAVAITLTTFDCDTGRIYDADITLNGTNFSFTTDGRAGLPKADIQNTVTHEAGHVLGFDHEPDATSVMYFQEPLGEISKRTLTPADVAGVCVVYPKLTTPPAGQGGCSAADGGELYGTALAALALLLGSLWRRLRRP